MEAIVRKTVITVGYVLVCCCNNEILDGSEAHLRESSSRSYLEDAEKSVQAVQKMSALLKFNNEQCKYLCDKLCVVIQSARSFLEVSGREEVGTNSKNDDRDFDKIFELLMVSGKQIKTFAEGCCKDNWIQAAMMLTNVSDYVSSLGFNLDLCKVAFGMDLADFTLDEVNGMNKSEAELVKQKASVDAESLKEKVVEALNSLHGEDRNLASYLLQRLLEMKRITSSESGTFLSNLFAWVKYHGKQVGRGASATVFEAMWLGTQVAMKRFDGPENQEFEKEVKILSRLCHPNITSVLCFTKDSRSCSIVMELMDGDLNQLIDKLMRSSDQSANFRPFHILEAVDIMLQIGEGVNYLHNQKIVHRDLKSGNILYKAVQVKDTGIQGVHVKVADFGLSKARDTNTTYSELTCNTGTNRWMPPEVIRLSHGNQGGMPSINEVSPKYPYKLDSYSFGLVCYEILVGKLPFSEYNNPKEVKKRILNNERPTLPCNPSECPLMLKDLIEKCWSHEPEKRPDFDEICRELKYLKYLLMIGGSMMHGVVDCRMGEKIADGKSMMSEDGHLDNKDQPGSHCLPSTSALVAPKDRDQVPEVWSRSLQMSACVNTPTNYLTPHSKSSMDKSPSSCDRLKSSPYSRTSSLQFLQSSAQINHLTSPQTSDLGEHASLKQLPLGKLNGMTIPNLEVYGSLPLLLAKIGQSTGLATLNLRECEGSKYLQVEIGQLTGLTTLDLEGYGNWKQLPVENGQLTRLTTLKLWGCEGLEQLPVEIGQLIDLTTLGLRECKGLKHLPVQIGQLTSLTTLDLWGCEGLQQLPVQIGQLTGLTTLDLWGCEGLQQLPVQIGQLTSLTTLKLGRCEGLQHLPVQIGQLTGLTTLNLRRCGGLEQLPSEIGQLTGLTTLDLQGCKGLQQLPVQIGQLTDLTTLDFEGCEGLQHLPVQIGQLTGLTTLDLWGCEGLQQLPVEIGQLTGLTTLDLRGCKGLQQLPVQIGQLTGLTTLNLRRCGGLEQLPSEIGQLTGLTTLDLQGCRGLQQLPVQIGQLTDLTTLDFEGCEGLQHLPVQIGQLTGLTTLDLWGCEGLQQLPVEIGQLTGLTTLDLRGCKGLQQLPVQIGQLTGLTTLQFERCEGLQHLPVQIGQLTGLTTLDLEGCEGLQQLPVQIGQLTRLTTLKLWGCEGLEQLPVEIGQLTGLTTLDLRRCKGLQQLPIQIGQLIGLTTLDLRGCKRLQQLPVQIGQLTSLTTLQFEGCEGLQHLPVQIGQLTRLTTLKLWGCGGLEQLPAEIGQLVDLRTLDLRGCKGLQQLPVQIGQLTRLTTLKLWGCGGLEQLPAAIGQLTGLMTLDLEGCGGLE